MICNRSKTKLYFGNYKHISAYSLPYFYYLGDKFRKLEGSSFFSYYNLKLELILARRVRFDGLLNRSLKYLQYVFISFKYDSKYDPYYIFLNHVEQLTLPVYLYKKPTKRSYVPLDKKYQIRTGYRLFTIYRGCRLIVTSIILNQKFKLYFNFYKELNYYVSNELTSSISFMEGHLHALFVNRRSRYIVYS